MASKPPKTAAARVASPRTFPLFSRLPPELRAEVWLYALPESPEPAIHNYEHELRELIRVTRASVRCGFNALETPNNHDNSDISMPSRPEKLDQPFNTAIDLVSHESRQIMLDWAKKQAPLIRSVAGRGLVRRFDPLQDVLYVIWFMDFDSDVLSSDSPTFEPEWTASRPSFRVLRLAMDPQILFLQHRYHDLELHNFLKGGVLYIICTEKEFYEERNWQIGDALRGVFTWHADTKLFHFESDGSEDLHRFTPSPRQGWPAVADHLTYWERLQPMLEWLEGRLSQVGSIANGYEVRPVRIHQRRKVSPGEGRKEG